MRPNYNIANQSKPGAGTAPPTQAQNLFGQALALHHKGLLAQAQDLYHQVLTLQRDHFEALHLLGVIAAQSKNYAAAVDFIGRSVAINPDNAVAHANLGNAFRDFGQYQAAIDSYDKAIALKPDYVNVYFHRGNALYQLRQYQAAINSYDSAIAIKPDFAEVYCNRGLALSDWKRLEAAIDSYDKAIAIAPAMAQSHFNRGLALTQLKQHRAAIDSYERAIAVRPDYASAYFNRGNALCELRQHHAALESFDKVLAIEPDYEYLRGVRLHTRRYVCDWRDEKDNIAELNERIQRNEKVCPPFSFLALSTSLPLQRKVAELYAKQKYPASEELGAIPKRARGQKIRIGYFSMDFRDHAVSFLTAGLFETHDRDRFEVYAFSFGPDVKDGMRARLEAAFDQFLDVKDKSDQEVAQMARRMKIDIAIDLAGFTNGSRTGIFALRAAPIQVSYLGYPGTMGVDYMDYLIADRVLIPEESRHHYSERVVYLPSFQANDRKRNISDKLFVRAELGLPATGFVFCCFNNSYKVSPQTFEGWMRVLKRVEDSVLFLYVENQMAVVNLTREASERGVNAGRFVFGQRLAVPEYLARYRAADLFLDTLPFNAGTTASDALWEGLPVLTCTGEALASRMAASLLSAIGLPELITHTQQDYEALAIELATHPERLKAIRQKLERNRLTMPLFDTALFTKHIEQAYTRMLDLYQADLPPEPIYVSRTLQSDSAITQ